jgi:hypothetical protein
MRVGLFVEDITRTTFSIAPPWFPPFKYPAVVWFFPWNQELAAEARRMQSKRLNRGLRGSHDGKVTVHFFALSAPLP